MRWYVRVPEQKKIRIRQVPGTDDFLKAYQEALIHIPPPSKLRPIIQHSLQALVNMYYASQTWRALSPATQKQRRSILGRICKEHGDRDARTLTPKAVRQGRDARRDTPGAANNMLKTLKALYLWGCEQELVDHNPVNNIKRLPMNPDGFHTWSTDECLKFENTHPIGTTPRAAYALGLYSGLRRSDIIRIGPPTHHF